MAWPIRIGTFVTNGGAQGLWFFWGGSKFSGEIFYVYFGYTFIYVRIYIDYALLTKWFLNITLCFSPGR